MFKFKNLLMVSMLLLFAACEECPTPGEDLEEKESFKDKFVCDGTFTIPGDTIFTIGKPYPNYHNHIDMSPNGKKFVYQTYAPDFAPGETKYFKIYDIVSRQTKKYNLQELLPDNVYLPLGEGNFSTEWCPYDNNKLAIYAVTSVDKKDDSTSESIFCNNSYIYNIKEDKLTKITPSRFDFKETPTPTWLKSSKPGYDLFHYGSNYDTYHLQKDEFIASPIPEYGYTGGASPAYQSPNTNNIFQFLTYQDQKHIIHTINGREVVLENNREWLVGDLRLSAAISWSPDSKYLALNVNTCPEYYYHNREDTDKFPHEWNYPQEIWILNVEKYLNQNLDQVPVEHVIRFEDGSGYELLVDVEFSSNNTLYASMIDENASKRFGHIYEINFQGDVLRQVTYAY